MKINKLIKGQSMFEVLVAIFIITLITVGVIVVSTTSVANSTFSRNSTLAGRYAQEAIEWLRDEEATNTTLFKTTRVSQSRYCLDSLAWGNINACSANELINDTTGADTVFGREVVLTSSQISGKNIIQAVVDVYWTDSKGTHHVSSTTNFSDIREK